MRKTQILTNTVYLGLSILDLSNTEIYEFWYDYVKPTFLLFVLQNLILLYQKILDY